ncbi:hypothetical protein EUX98_g4817 [Antrodiella citrinella]|uniref:Uncharacterized protein n=1 Tax=Antrodiella citrinella TaxID=2447956 RepID=A0A4S4MT35_9APHY|nr:hypothetical protein EUX98_g4817 [Antrodiella citrinella]
MSTTLRIIILLTAAAASTAASVSPSPTRSRPPTSSVPAPSPIPFPYVPKWEFLDDADVDAFFDEAIAQELPELPFEYHRPTDTATPTDYFPWEGLYRTPKMFFSDDEDDEDEEEDHQATQTTSTPSHMPTPFLMLNPDLRDVVAGQFADGERPSFWQRDTSDCDDNERDETLIEELLRDQGGEEDKASGTVTAQVPQPEEASDVEPFKASGCP